MRRVLRFTNSIDGDSYELPFVTESDEGGECEETPLSLALALVPDLVALIEEADASQLSVDVHVQLLANPV